MIGLKYFAIDIDDNILFNDKIYCPECGRVKYKLKKVDKEEIKLINKLYKKGHIIILYTGRNWDCYKLTKQQLKEAKVKYHELVMGKPQGIYVDKEAVKSVKDVK